MSDLVRYLVRYLVSNSVRCEHRGEVSGVGVNIAMSISVRFDPY
jgi:hypothetical protein